MGLLNGCSSLSNRVQLLKYLVFVITLMLTLYVSLSLEVKKKRHSDTDYWSRDHHRIFYITSSVIWSFVTNPVPEKKVEIESMTET